MDYEEALNKVEYFMNKSGIRDFCTDTCQGFCCGSCYTSKNACYRNEGRRLSCSVFLCQNLKDLLFNSVEMTSYLEMDETINYELAKLMPGHINIYYKPHTKEVRDKFYIEDRSLDILDKIDTVKIKNKLKAIKNIHINSSRFLVQKLNNRS